MSFISEWINAHTGLEHNYTIGYVDDDDPIFIYFDTADKYPGNNKQWWVSKAQADDADEGIKAGDFIPNMLIKLWTGNTLAPRGHFILEAFNKRRSSVSDATGIPDEIVDERPSTTAFYSGRTWFGCNSTVYFSQVLTSKHKAGLCYQEADPTSEDISDLVATDGGVIPVPEANKIIKLVPNGDGILVFAVGGVWSITGSGGGFSALDFNVSKISPVGCLGPHAIVETEEGVFWWSESGVMAVSQTMGAYGPMAGSFEHTNISQTTIQQFYEDIPIEAKKEAKALYDAESNCIHWLYRDDDVSTRRYNRVLTLDLNLTAFYPWKFSTLSGSDPPYVKGFFLALETADEDDVNSRIKYVTMKNNELSFAQLHGTEFADWFSENDEGIGYNSFVETGYELFDDAMRDKNITYIITYLSKTDQTYDEYTGETDRPSSCWMTIKYDWANSGVSNKWTDPVQIYRFNRMPLMTSGNFDTGYPIVTTKQKVRGNGKSIQFRFGTDEVGKDFDLLGWSIVVTGGTVV